MFIATLLTITRTWKQPFSSSTEEWIKKMCYIYTMEYSSAIKKKIPICSNMIDFKTVILSKESQRKKNIIGYHFYVESEKGYK